MIQKVYFIPCEKPVSPELNISAESTKNNSSIKRVVSIRVVARPKPIPSELRKTGPSELPPTADGVIQFVNSHIMSTVHACLQLSLRSVRALKRHISPKSRIPIQISARNTQNTDQREKCICFHTLARFSPLASCQNISTTTPNPMNTGKSTFHIENAFLDGIADRLILSTPADIIIIL